MKKRFVQILSVLLALVLLPWTILAEGYTTEPLYRSDFTFRIQLNADAFPNDGEFHYSDWETFLNKLSIKGRIDFQRLSEFIDQYARMDANLQLNEKSVFPFRYESYGVSRLLTAASLGEDSLFFNMINFWQFMMKPYYFMGLPTNLFSVLLTWDMSSYTVNEFLDALNRYFGSEEKLSHEEMLSRAEELSSEIMNQDTLLYYFFVQCTLVLIYGDGLVYEDLCNLRDIADALDPEEKGFRKETENGATRYIIGDTTVLTVEDGSWHFDLPDTNGYEFILDMQKTEDEIHFLIKALLGEDVRLNLVFHMDGLKTDENHTNEGDISVEVSGGAIADSLSEESYSARVHYCHERSSDSLPRAECFTADWYHPTTGKAAIGIRYEAEISEADVSEIKNDKSYRRTKSDFFALNSDILAELKEKYAKPLILSLVPVALEIPVGVYSDVYMMLKDSGFLAMLGFEGLE